MHDIFCIFFLLGGGNVDGGNGESYDACCDSSGVSGRFYVQW